MVEHMSCTRSFCKLQFWNTFVSPLRTALPPSRPPHLPHQVGATCACDRIRCIGEKKKTATPSWAHVLGSEKKGEGSRGVPTETPPPGWVRTSATQTDAQYPDPYLAKPPLQPPNCHLRLTKTTQRQHFVGCFWIFIPTLVWILLKTGYPSILDIENSKIKVPWPNETVSTRAPHRVACACAGLYAEGSPGLSVLNCTFIDIAKPIAGDDLVEQLYDLHATNDITYTSGWAGPFHWRLPYRAVYACSALALIYALLLTGGIVVVCLQRTQEDVGRWLGGVAVSLLWDLAFVQVCVCGFWFVRELGMGYELPGGPGHTKPAVSG